jgi:outer membrane protein assembly factor BamA
LKAIEALQKLDRNKNRYKSKRNSRFLYHLIGMVLLVAFFSSCVAPRFYGKDKYLIRKNKVKGNKELKNDELSGLVKQRPNRKILGTTPYAYAYVLGKKSWDSLGIVRKIEETVEKYDREIAVVINNPSGNYRKDSLRQVKLENKKERKLNKLNKRRTEGNFWMRTIGEKPAYFDSAQATASKIEIEKYYYQHGFFSAHVALTIDTVQKNKINTTYTVTEGKRRFFRSVKYACADTAIYSILQKAAGSCYIKIGTPFDLAVEEGERARIELLIRNNGYIAFARSYIVIDNDTADEAGQTDVLITVAVPKDRPFRQYKIGKVTLVLKEAEEGFKKRDSVYYNNILFVSERKYNWRILAAKLLLKPGDIYQQDRLNNAQIALNSMDMFRFVNVRLDTAGKTEADLYYETTRLPRYQLTDEIGILVSAGAPGPFANATFRTRNFFNNWSNFEISGRYSQEGQISVFLPDSIYRASEFGASMSLFFPQLLIPGKSEYFYSKINPRTRITIGYTNSRRPEYGRRLFRASFTYGIKSTPTSYIEFSPIDATIGFTPYINPIFQTQLEEFQQSLRQSFNNFFISNVNGNYTFSKGQLNSQNKYTYFRFMPEVGGLLGTIVSRSNGNNPDSIGSLKVFKYWRVFSEFRKNYPLGAFAALAYRVQGGIAGPLGNSQTLPWEKFFFAGGTNSLRAWPPRRLGPGSYKAAVSESQFQFERPGEILLEANIELRQKLFKFLEGALFIDAGNVWNRKGGAEQVGSEFNANRFYKEIAVGTGFGVRLNFSFFILRLDFGIKVYDPSETEGNRYVLPQEYKNVVANFGVGYPF